MSEVDTENCPQDVISQYVGQIARISEFLSKNVVLGSAVVLGLNLVGFLVVSVYFWSRGVPIEEIGFGARTVWVALLIFSLPILLVIFFLSAMLNGNFMAELAPKFEHLLRDVFKRRPKDENYSKKPVILKHLKENIYHYLSVFSLTTIPLVLITVTLTAPHLFFGNLRYTATAWQYQLGYILISLVMALLYLVQSRLSSAKKKTVQEDQTADVDSTTAHDKNAIVVVDRLQRVSNALIISMLFMAWILLFFLHLYPKMRPEFGGGKPQIVTMHFTESRLAQMSLGDPPASVPDSKLARKVKIIYETEEDFRISPVEEPNPPVIYTVNKQDVTLVAISPQE